MNRPYNVETTYHFNNRDKATIDSWLPLWPSGQWEDMFVTQPPPQRVVVWIWAGTDGFQDRLGDLSIENSAGVRLGQLAKILKEFDIVEEEDGVWEGMDFNVAEVEQVYAEEERDVFFRIENWVDFPIRNVVGSST